MIKETWWQLRARWGAVRWWWLRNKLRVLSRFSASSGPSIKLGRSPASDVPDPIQQYYWWHTIDLGGGILTPGRKNFELMKLEAEAVFSPLNLTGKSVLDVGAWNGGFSVEAARRGASRVVGLDHFTWNEPRFKGRETFDLVVRATGLPIDGVDIDLDRPGLSLTHLGEFDVVLYLGVFYHLKDPLAATREIAALAKEVLVVETHIEEFDDERPAMVFYPGAELDHDSTNWWGPNVACVTELLKHFGFRRIEMTQPYRGTRRIFHAFR
jgi:tRNA (mo5U34)-methyltransferase